MAVIKNITNTYNKIFWHTRKLVFNLTFLKKIGENK